ncbi:unnamed protein product [Zymoseptoria tritici ST99CH_3D1]|nr:unnamed protein product [Zymoseptoria tritici ST99CH_3D1]
MGVLYLLPVVLLTVTTLCSPLQSAFDAATTSAQSSSPRNDDFDRSGTLQKASPDALASKKDLASQFTPLDWQHFMVPVIWHTSERASLQTVRGDDKRSKEMLDDFWISLSLDGLPDAVTSKLIYEEGLSRCDPSDISCRARDLALKAMKAAHDALIQSQEIRLGPDFAAGAYDDRGGLEIAKLQEDMENLPFDDEKFMAALIKGSKPIKTTEVAVNTSHVSSFTEGLLFGGICIVDEYSCSMSIAKQQFMADFINAVIDGLEESNIVHQVLLRSRDGRDGVKGDAWNDIDLSKHVRTNWKTLADDVIAKEIEETKLLAEVARDYDADTTKVFDIPYFDGPGRLLHLNGLLEGVGVPGSNSFVEGLGYRFFTTAEGPIVARRYQGGVLQTTDSGVFVGIDTGDEQTPSNETSPSSSSETSLSSSSLDPRSVHSSSSAHEAIQARTLLEDTTAEALAIAPRAPPVDDPNPPGLSPTDPAWRPRKWVDQVRPALMRSYGPTTAPPATWNPRSDIHSFPKRGGSSIVQVRRESAASQMGRCGGMCGSATDAMGNSVMRVLQVEGAAVEVMEPMMLSNVVLPVEGAPIVDIYGVRDRGRLKPGETNGLPKWTKTRDGLDKQILPYNQRRPMTLWTEGDPHPPPHLVLHDDLEEFGRIDPAELLEPVAADALTPHTPLPKGTRPGKLPRALKMNVAKTVPGGVRAAIAADDAAALVARFITPLLLATEGLSMAPFFGTVGVAIKAAAALAFVGLTIYEAVEFLKPQETCPQPTRYTSIWDSSAMSIQSIVEHCAEQTSQNASQAANQVRSAAITPATFMPTPEAVLPAQRREAKIENQAITAATMGSEDLNKDDPPQTKPSLPLWNPDLLTPGLTTSTATTCLSTSMPPGYTAVVKPGFPCPIKEEIECTEHFGRTMAIKLQLRTNPNSMINPTYCLGDMSGHRRAEHAGCLPDFDTQECLDTFFELPKGTKAVKSGRGDGGFDF